MTLCYCVDEVNARCSSDSTSFVVRLTFAASSLCACQCRRWLDGARFFFFFFFPVFFSYSRSIFFYFQFELQAHKNPSPHSPFNCVRHVQELFVICGRVSLERGHIFCSHLPIVDCFAYDYFAGHICGVSVHSLICIESRKSSPEKYETPAATNNGIRMDGNNGGGGNKRPPNKTERNAQCAIPSGVARVLGLLSFAND